jgi:peptide/nickel transport system ATP-binding protein
VSLGQQPNGSHQHGWPQNALENSGRTRIEIHPHSLNGDTDRQPILRVKDLHTQFSTHGGVVKAVDGVSFSLYEREVLGIVGESGCGKSVTALTLMGLVPTPPGRVGAGEVWLAGRDLLTLSKSQMQHVRGKEMAMIFQDPMTSLNPVLTIGHQIAEALRLHKGMDRATARRRSIELLDLVGIPAARQRVDSYPHQFSGGMRQRAMIAMALSCEPKVLIADEPTTALDVTIQAQILELLDRLRRDLSMAVILITHDLGVVASIADRVEVMYAGHIVESSTVDQLFNDPHHPYTLGLMDTIPRVDSDLRAKLKPIKGRPPDLIDLAPGCPFRPRCPYSVDRCAIERPDLQPIADGQSVACWVDLSMSPTAKITAALAPRLIPNTDTEDEILKVRDLRMHFHVKTNSILRRQAGVVRAVDGISFTIKRGETLGLVGESGCGKSTTGRAILQLHRPTSGEVEFMGTELTNIDEVRMRTMRQEMQVIFQDPYASLNPRMTVTDIIGEPLTVHELVTAKEKRKRVQELMRTVGLNPKFANRHPHEFSGGQRQRIGVARALAVEPKFIVCDEPVSALDVSIQAQVINLLDDLQHEFGLTYLFIAHDLGVVRHISDRVAVMYLGKIVEMASRDSLYSQPLHPYSQALLSSVPIPHPTSERERQRTILKGDVPSPADPPDGCSFHTRCPFAQDVCREQEPPLSEIDSDREVACHFWDEILQGRLTPREPVEA